MKPSIVLLIAFLSVLPLCGQSEERPPNVVIIMADDLGWNGLGCYGSELAQTPCLDQLAAEGMRFTDAYALSQCLPTRAAIFSGQYGARTGLTSVETSSPSYAPMISPGRPKALEPEVYTLFEMLRDAGYKTGMSGKLHLGGPLDTNSALKNKNRGMEYFHDYGLQWAGTATPNRNDKNVSAITDDIIEFIEENRDGPFIAYAAHRSPHMPLEVPPSSVQRAVDRGFKRSSNPRGLFSERVTADYVAMIEYLDSSIGRITDKLDELGIAENTLLLFLSDNGGLTRVWKNDPLRGGKGQLYEGGSQGAVHCSLADQSESWKHLHCPGARCRPVPYIHGPGGSPAEEGSNSGWRKSRSATQANRQFCTRCHFFSSSRVCGWLRKDTLLYGSQREL